MKLIYNPLGAEFDIRQDCINTIVIENNFEFEKFVLKIKNQMDKQEETFYTDEEKSTFFKRCQLITSPFELCFTAREVQKNLYSNLLDDLEANDIVEKLLNMHNVLIDCLETLNLNSNINFDYNEEFNILNLFKYLDVRLQESHGAFSERLIDYCDISYKLLNKDILILANCDAYILDNEFNQLFSELIAREIKVIIVRNRDIPLRFSQNKYIIDTDLCVLH